MKILYVLSSTAFQGGSTKAFISMLNGLQERGIQISVVCPSVKGKGNTSFITNMNSKGITVHVIPYRTNTYPQKRTWKDLVLFLPKLLYHFYLNDKAFKSLLKICSEERFDIVHTNVSVINIGYRVALKLQIPHIYHIREYQDLDFGMKIIPSKENFINKLLLCYSICITRDIQKHFHLESYSRSKVIYDGVKPMNAIRFIEEKGEYFLFVGRFVQFDVQTVFFEADRILVNDNHGTGINFPDVVFHHFRHLVSGRKR